MDMRNALPSRFLKAADIDEPMQFIIKQVVMEHVQQGKDPQPVVYFRGKEKGLVLNKVNNKKLMDLFGHESKEWLNNTIVLFKTEIEMAGETVDAIRIRADFEDPSTTKAIKDPKPKPARKDELEDDVPF